MPGRVVEFPVPESQRLCEPVEVQWVSTGRRTASDGDEVSCVTRCAMTLRSDGTWTYRVKPHGSRLWRCLHGDAATTALDFLRAAMGLEFEGGYPSDRGEKYVAFGAMLLSLVTLLG